MKICNNIFLPIIYCDCKENECQASPFKNKMKQTAVEWFFSQLPEKTQANNEKEYWQAKAMEKEQIMNAYIDGEHQQGFEGEAEQYYNETYNK